MNTVILILVILTLVLVLLLLLAVVAGHIIFGRRLLFMIDSINNQNTGVLLGRMVDLSGKQVELATYTRVAVHELRGHVQTMLTIHESNHVQNSQRLSAIETLLAIVVAECQEEKSNGNHSIVDPIVAGATDCQ